MKKRKLIYFLAMFILMMASFSTVSYSASAEKDSEVENFYQTQTYIPEDRLPLDSKSNFITEEETPFIEIERSSLAKVYNESGEVVDTYQIKSNIDSEKKLATNEGKVATVLVAVDEEYRKKFSNWQERTSNIVELTDNAFVRDFNIDLDVKAFRYWTSTGNNSQDILESLKGNGKDKYDFVIGFVDDANYMDGGLAYVYKSPPTYAAYSTVLDQSTTATSRALQHELSHNYGLDHDPTAPEPLCTMNYYNGYTTTQWHSAHKSELGLHINWYGTSF